MLRLSFDSPWLSSQEGGSDPFKQVQHFQFYVQDKNGFVRVASDVEIHLVTSQNIESLLQTCQAIKIETEAQPD